MSLYVTEIFYSIQGEGMLAGTVATFVRLSGCDLHCQWCDTQYAWPHDAGQAYTLDNLIKEIEKYASPYVVVTGGEPLETAELGQFLEHLKMAGKHITLETAARQYRPLTLDLISISPKLSNAITCLPPSETKSKRLNLGAIRRYIERHDYQLKFVVRGREDLAEIDTILSELSGIRMDKVLLMPQAVDLETYRQRAPAVAELCIERGFRFGPRLHLTLWPGQRGK